MKFDKHQYFKHQACRDMFISVRHVRFDDDGLNALLVVDYCVQGVNGWWVTPVVDERLVIKPKHYNRWVDYAPKGSYRF